MRTARQEAIRRILRRHSVGTQDELRAALRRAGQAADQSTLSRDLAELGVRKHGGRYVLPADNGDAGRGTASAAASAVPAPGHYAALVRGFLPCGPHLVVLRTAIGQAQPVAVAIDTRADPAIAGTLAGDDVVFLATRSRRAQAVALRRLASWFGDKREH